MKLTDIKNSLNEISAIGGLKQIVKGNTDRVEGIKLSKEMAQAMIDWFNSSPYGRKYPKAAKARLHLSLGIMMSFGLDRYAKHKGAKEELKYISDLSKAMRDNVNEDDNPCWKNYQMVGMKKKNGKDVPNCVPEGLKEGVMSDIHLTIKSSSTEEEFIKKFFKKYGKQVKPNKESMEWVKDLYSDTKNESVNESTFAGWIAGYNGKKIEIKKGEAKDLYNAKLLAIKKLKVPKSKVGLMFIKPAVDESVVNEGKDVGHYERVGNQTIVDSNFVNYSKGVLPNSELVHLGMGDFAIKSQSGMIKFQRSGKMDGIGQDFVGRPHRMTDDKNGKLVELFLKLMLKKKKAILSMSESVMNEAKYDIGMARKGNGLTVYNKAEEENGDYKNVAHIDSKGKIKYYDKKVPSNIKKQIEAEAKKMMEITKEGTMKLKDILKESFENGKVYSNPFHTPFVKENDEERREESSEMTTEQKQAFLEAVKAYKSFGETVYRNEGLSDVYESIRGLVESAGKNMVKETEGSFDGITVSRHVKRMNESFRIFEKTLREVGTLQQRLESTYDEIGEVLGKYYEINESHDEEETVEEGNEFGAARAKAIANGDSEFSVDGKTYPVKSVDKDDKENAKEFSNESKSMKLTSMLNESFGFGELPSSKLMKMKVSAKDMLASVSNKKVNESEEVEEEEINEGGFATWEMSFADMNLGGVKLSKKNVYKVKARNTVEAIKKASKMAGLPDKYWLATQTHSLKKIG